MTQTQNACINTKHGTWWRKHQNPNIWRKRKDLIRITGAVAEGNGTPLQCSRLENPMDGGAWWAAVHGVAKSRTRVSDFLLTFHFHALEKEMATHSNVLVWRIPGMAEPDGLLSMGSHRVRHSWSNLAAAAVSSQGKRHFVETLKMSKRQLIGEGIREELVDLEEIRVKYLARSSWTWGERWKAVWELNNCCCWLVAQLCLILCYAWTAACQLPLPMGFSRKECWSGSPFPSPGHLSNPGIEPTPPGLQIDSLQLSQQGILSI